MSQFVLAHSVKPLRLFNISSPEWAMDSTVSFPPPPPQFFSLKIIQHIRSWKNSTTPIGISSIHSGNLFPNWQHIICPFISFPHSRAGLVSIILKAQQTLTHMQIYIRGKFSGIDLRCAKGSIPLVNIWKVPVHLFLSRLLTSKTVYISVAHIQVLLIQSVCLSTYIPKPCSGFYVSWEKPLSSNMFSVPWALLSASVMQQWLWVLSLHGTYNQMAVILTTHERRTHEQAGAWRRMGWGLPGALKCLQVGSHLCGHSEATHSSGLWEELVSRD